MDKLASLSPFIRAVACQKATEYPFTGRFLKVISDGTYLCRRCGLALWSTQFQFSSHCGWPSFDDRFKNSIDEVADEDGQRTEILCHRCHSHLGHVFRGEGFTSKNQRDCVNSVMLDFSPVMNVYDTEEVIVAGGCFWGVEHLLKSIPGVILTECGYTGGHLPNPSYQDVCHSNSGHLEAVRVLYDIKITESSKIYQYFFEIHDPSQFFGQGPDIGPQYRSAIFYYDDIQKNQANKLIHILKKKGMKIATELKPVSVFWSAEEYHQNYYEKHHKTPYCHRYTQRF